MKVVAVLFAAVLAVALAEPQLIRNPEAHYARSPEADAVVVRSDLDNIGVDGYNWVYDTSNQISAEEQGQLQNVGTDQEAMVVRGSYRYVAPDGVTYEVTYTADENGFHPEGAHIPH